MPARHDIIYSFDQATVDAAFFGYGFQGTDLVIGAEGYADFTASGRVFQGDHDGCYLNVQPNGTGETVFSTDFHGYFPLFYYRGPSVWIISPSFELVAQAAHQRKLPLTLRRHQLDAWKSKVSMLQSAASDRTPFDEIRLLPYDRDIIAGPDGNLTIRQKNRHPSNTSYALALADLVALWQGRIMTILDGGMAIRADLTGGVDSRTVLSLMLHALQRTDKLGLLHSDRILINSQLSKPEDYEIACQIGQKFGFPVNNPKRRKYVMASDDDGFTTWKRYNLARYSPHILPMTTQDSNIITLNGLGGGEQRAVYETYGQGLFGGYLGNQRQQFSELSGFQAWLGDTLDDLDVPLNEMDGKMRAAVRNYRRHRGRHHTAKQPASEFMGVILGSRSAYECAYYLDTAAIEANQLLFDIMINCNEPLARMPYDKPTKAPAQINFDRLTRLDNIDPAKVGRIWRRPTATPAPMERHGRNIPLRNAVEAAIKRPQVRALAGDATLEKLQLQLEKLTPSNNLHQEGHLLHYALLADVVSKYI